MRGYTYHSNKLRYTMERMLGDIREYCEGRNLSVFEITKDEYGKYNEERLRSFIEEVIDAGTETRLLDAAYKDYLKTLLYIVIRAAQAGRFGLRHLLVQPGTDSEYRIPEDDSISYIINQLKGKHEVLSILPFRTGKKTAQLSDEIKTVITTLYTMLSGESAFYPDPYMTEAVKEKSPAPATDAAPEDFEVDDSYYSWDDDDFDPEALSEEYMYYDADGKSRDEYEQDVNDDLNSEMEAKKKYLYEGLNVEGQKEIFDQEVKRLKVFFPYRDEFIKTFRHLADITGPDLAEHDLESCLEKSLKEYLRKNGYTIYSDEDGFDEAFQILNVAMDTIRERQHKIMKKTRENRS